MTDKPHRWTNSDHRVVLNLMQARQDAIEAQLAAMPDENLFHARGRVVEVLTRVAGGLTRNLPAATIRRT